MATPAIPADPTLDGVHLTGTSTSEWSVLPREARRVDPLNHGGHREYLAWPGPLQPQIKVKMEVVFTWESLRAQRATVDELLAVPGLHPLVLWRHEVASWSCDGAAAEFQLPWRLAPHVIATPPGGHVMSKFEPRTKVGRDGSWLTYLPKEEEDYEADDPAEGEVWYLVGGQVFKLSEPPAAGTVIFAHLVPVFLMFQGEPSERRFNNPAAEPRRVALLER